jgi:hypothetical protein
MPTTKHQKPSASLTILVRPYDGRYIAICKETGVIREARSFEDARDAIFSATLTLLREVEKDPEAAINLSLGLSLGMRLFFDWSVLMFQILRMRKVVEDTLFVQGSAGHFPGLLPTHA